MSIVFICEELNLDIEDLGMRLCELNIEIIWKLCACQVFDEISKRGFYWNLKIICECCLMMM